MTTGTKLLIATQMRQTWTLDFGMVEIVLFRYPKRGRILRIARKNNKIYSFWVQFHGILPRLPIGFRNFEVSKHNNYFGNLFILLYQYDGK